MVDGQTLHNPQPTHLGKNSTPDGNSVTVIHSSYGEQDVINLSLNIPSITSGSFSEFSEDQLEQAYGSSTGGGTLRTNKNVNKSTKNADDVSVLINRTNRCVEVQINKHPVRHLQHGPVRDVVIFTKKPRQPIQVFINLSCSAEWDSAPQQRSSCQTQQCSSQNDQMTAA